MVTDIGPATVDLLGQQFPLSATRYCFQRKAFYANGRHWAFYVNGDPGEGIFNFVYNSSVDGTTWGSPTTIRPANSGEEACVWLEEFIENGDPQAYYVHYVYSDMNGGDLLYRRGELNANGTITWDTAEQTASEGIPGIVYLRPTICIDDTGLPYIGYTFSVDGLPYVICSTSAPVWTTKAGFPYPMYGLPDPNWVCVVVPFGSQIHVTFVAPMGNIMYDIYNPTLDSWNGTIPSMSWIGADSFRISVTSHGQVDALEGLGYWPTVHVAFQDAMQDTYHTSFDEFTGPSIDHIIIPGPEDKYPAISIKRYGGPKVGDLYDPPRTLYVFWIEPHNGIVFYMMSIDGGITWTDASGTPFMQQPWLVEDLGPMPDIDLVTSYFEEGRKYDDEDAGYMGCLWSILGLSPDLVRYGALGFVDPDENLKCGFIVRHSESDAPGAPFEILGKFIARGGNALNLLAGFEARQTAAVSNLQGGFLIRQIATRDLKAGFEGQATTELLGGFTVRHAAARDLKAGFRPGQDTKDIWSVFNARHSAGAELPGEFEIRRSATGNLKGGFLIRHSASRDLKGEFEVGQGWENLPGELIVRHSADSSFLGKFISRHSSSRDLKGGWIIRRSASRDLKAGFIVRHSASLDLPAGFIVMQGIADLSAEMIIRHSGTAELLCGFIVRHSASRDLKAGLVISRPNWAPQGITYEEYLLRIRSTIVA